MFIVIAILAFGVIIVIHELGHFIAAKIMGVKVDEFAIGMGPKILSKQGKETLYSLRLFPFGGFCAMENDDVSVGEGRNNLRKNDNTNQPAYALAGADFPIVDDTEENYQSDYDYTNDVNNIDDDSDDPDTPNPRAFSTQKIWRRIVILVAGSFANLVFAFIIILIMTAGATGFIGTTLTEEVDNMPALGPSELLPGDRLLYINNERLFYHNDFWLFMEINESAGTPITITLERDGEIIEYERRTFIVDGVQTGRYSIYPTSFNLIEATALESIKFSLYQMYNFARLIRISIGMIIDGIASVNDFMGPVGMVDVMNTMGQESPTIAAGIANIASFAAFIGVNVAVMNLLPIPALDGGRVIFILITWIVEKTTRRKLDPKYEAYINTGVFVLLVGFMIFILYNDIARLVVRIFGESYG